jgi:hypothetical protein
MLGDLRKFAEDTGQIDLLEGLMERQKPKNTTFRPSARELKSKRRRQIKNRIARESRKRNR